MGADQRGSGKMRLLFLALLGFFSVFVFGEKNEQEDNMGNSRVDGSIEIFQPGSLHLMEKREAVAEQKKKNGKKQKSKKGQKKGKKLNPRKGQKNGKKPKSRKGQNNGKKPKLRKGQKWKETKIKERTEEWKETK